MAETKHITDLWVDGKVGIGVDGSGLPAPATVGNILRISKTFGNDANAVAHNSINLVVDSVITSGVSQVRGILATVKNSATTTGTGVLSGALFTMQANGSQNYLTNNFTGVSISITTLSGQVGTIVDTNAIRINAPSFVGTKPTSSFGIQLFNQGASGVTISAAINIAAQSGSTSNYAFISASTNLHGFGTLTPTKTVDVTGDIQLNTAGNGIYIKEGTNATSGVATLVLGTKVVNTTKVTANSRIYLTRQNLDTIAVPVGLAVSARTAGTSFTILSGNLLDTSIIAWHIIEPA